MKKRIFVFFIFFLVSLVCFKLTKKNEFLSNRPHVEELLERATSKEREFFLSAFRQLFNTSTLGFTLFGDKPLSVLEIETHPRISRGDFFLNITFPIVRKYKKLLHSPNFVLFIEDGPRYSSVYLVNKKAFRNEFQQNIDVFRAILGPESTPETLLHSVLCEGQPFINALKGSHALLGILFGFGRENSLRFQRREEIEQSQYMQGFPPWKDCTNVSEMSLEERVLHNLNRRSCKSIEKQMNYLKKATPSPGFLTIQDELFDLDKKLSFCECYPCPPKIVSTAMIPGFCGDPFSEETKKILKKYEGQRQILRDIVQQQNLLEKVVEKFYELP